MAALISPLHAQATRERLATARQRIAAAAERAGRRDPQGIELLVATKYVALDDLPVLDDPCPTIAGARAKLPLIVDRWHLGR